MIHKAHPGALGDIDPGNVHAYLKGKGWGASEPHDGGVAVWSKPWPDGRGVYRVNVPATKQANSFKSHLQATLIELAEIEGRAIADIYEEWTQPKSAKPVTPHAKPQKKPTEKP
jgi:hypothetical protein